MMPPHSSALACGLAFLLHAGTAPAADPPGNRLEERMSDTEFKAAGLDLLSPEQLAYLNRWLGTKGIEAAVAPLKKRDGSMEFYVDESAREVVESRIVGLFEGWRGRTIVTLQNGQKWQQSESGARGDVAMTDPAVTIKPMSMGSWLMVVKGCNCSIRVKRIG